MISSHKRIKEAIEPSTHHQAQVYYTLWQLMVSSTWDLDRTNSLGTTEEKDNTISKERLDRGIGNTLWRELLPKANLINIPAHTSDHCPILLNTNGNTHHRPSLFWFEEMWMRDPSCRKVIQNAGTTNCRGFPMFKPSNKLKETKKAL